MTRRRRSQHDDTIENADAPVAFTDRDELARGTRALLIHPYVKSRGDAGRSPEAALEELKGLSEAIDLEIVGAELSPLSSIHPGTYIGSGKVAAFGELAKEAEAELVVVNAPLSPGQQRNLEKGFGAKVIDRTGLILEIFGARAQTKEGVLQVDLAHLTYQRGRLVRSWTHLERQRGGAGFMGGPGERQIEADRRLLSERIARLTRELETVKRTRGLHRQSRGKVPYPIVALVGYTNAGKSTLFNRLTNSGVFAEDLLFATLDPTLRGLTLPSGRRVILSDTVGFISDLPTHLIAAFRATLEEVVEADIVLHVRDISHPDTAAQKADVEGVLSSMDVPRDEQKSIEVLNKIDLLPDHDAEILVGRTGRQQDAVALSAITGQGVPDLLTCLDTFLTEAHATLAVHVPYEDGATVAWLHERGSVLRRAEGEEGADFIVRLSEQDRGNLVRRPNVTVAEAAE